MDPRAKHVVIVGGPEVEDELLAIVLDDGEAIPLFGSLEEAQEFLDAAGDLREDWRAVEVEAETLAEILEYQGEEVEYVALSPPPENLEGGMEVQVLHREVLADLLRRQSSRPPEPEGKPLWRRLLGR